MSALRPAGHLSVILCLLSFFVPQCFISTKPAECKTAGTNESRQQESQEQDLYYLPVSEGFITHTMLPMTAVPLH